MPDIIAAPKAGLLEAAYAACKARAPTDGNASPEMYLQFFTPTSEASLTKGFQKFSLVDESIQTFSASSTSTVG